MSDKEQATASLWDSPTRNVQHSPEDMKPEFSQSIEKAAERFPLVGSEDARYILPDNPIRPHSFNNSEQGKCDVATRVIQSFSESGNGERLAGRSGNDGFDCRSFLTVGCCVAIIASIRVFIGKETTTERIGLKEPSGFPAERFQGNTGTLDARAHRAENHTSNPRSLRMAAFFDSLALR
jgi:hypothetical protein